MAIYSGFSHEKWWFSIAMLVHQRVDSMNHEYPWLMISSSHHPIIHQVNEPRHEVWPGPLHPPFDPKVGPATATMASPAWKLQFCYGKWCIYPFKSTCYEKNIGKYVKPSNYIKLGVLCSDKPIWMQSHSFRFIAGLSIFDPYPKLWGFWVVADAVNGGLWWPVCFRSFLSFLY